MSNYLFSIEAFFSYFSIGYKKRRIICVIANNVEELTLTRLRRIKVGMTIDVNGITYVRMLEGFVRY